MNLRHFKKWISTMTPDIKEFETYVDFSKVYINIENIKFGIAPFNALIGSQSIEKDFYRLLKEYPNTKKYIPLLLAVRNEEIGITHNSQWNSYDFSDKSSTTAQEYAFFMKESGLFELLSNHLISNILDYITGVEVGLDTHARKNRVGTRMEQIVAHHLTSSGFKYATQVTLKRLEKEFGCDVEHLRRALGRKRIDFVVKTAGQVYIIETSFYSSSGSKPNETIRSYQHLSKAAQKSEGITFVWITDGGGWLKSLEELKAGYATLPHVYNLADLQKGIFKQIFK